MRGAGTYGGNQFSKMTWIILWFSLALLSIPFLIYSIYLLAIIFNKPKKYVPKEHNEPITIMFPARNEQEVIDRRIRNIAELNYPLDKIEVIMVDDHSEDNTVALAKKAFIKYKIKNKIIINSKRKGTNYNYNLGVKSASTEYIITTDADVVFEVDALNYLMTALKEDPKVGAACGDLKTVLENKTLSTSTETPYRNVYGKMCLWESKIGSTYCFNGPLILLRKSTFNGIPEKSGASDASAALNILQHGFKTIYVMEAQFSELIASDVKSQRKQKVRRATRLLEAGLNNINLMFNGTKFGNIVFPLRFMMLYISPTASFLGGILMLAFLFIFNIYWGMGIILFSLMIIFVGRIKSNFLSSFIWHNYYLMEGLLRVYRNNHLWQSIKRKAI